jgi:hypothetical protein
VGAGASLARISTRGGLQEDTGRFVCTQNPLMISYLLEAGGGPHLKEISKAVMTVSRSYPRLVRAVVPSRGSTILTYESNPLARLRRERETPPTLAIRHVCLWSAVTSRSARPAFIGGHRSRGTATIGAVRQTDCPYRNRVVRHQVAGLNQSVLSRGGISAASVPVRAMAAYASRAPAMTRVGPTGQLSAAARRCHPP